MTTDIQPGQAASWTDATTGIAEEAAFLGPDGAKVLAFVHRPTTLLATAGVVMCGSLYEDLTVNYRKELMVARELARRGIASVRFQYRGAGNSDDLPGGAVTFDSMVADAELAAAWLQERTGVTSIVPVGFRMGGFVAEHLAGPDEQTPLGLWTPVLSGADYFRTVSRASKMVGVHADATKVEPTEPGVKPPTSASTADDDAVEMMGYLVRNASRADLSARSLADATSAGRPVLFVQVALNDDLTAPNAQFVDRWKAGGADVEVLLVQLRQQWFVPDEFEAEDERPESNTLAVGIADWVQRTVGRSE